MKLSKVQRDGLNKAKDTADQIRKYIEHLESEDLQEGMHLTYAMYISNMMYELEKTLKAGEKTK